MIYHGVSLDPAEQNIAKLVSKINELIEVVSSHEETIEGLKDEVLKLTNFRQI